MQDDTASTRQRMDALVQMYSADATIGRTSTELQTSSLGSSVRPSTLGSSDSQEQLKQALDNMRLADPPDAFAKRYQLLAERVETGAQGLVQVPHLIQCPFLVSLSAKPNVTCPLCRPHRPIRVPDHEDTLVCRTDRVLVQFARSNEGGYQQYAIKFFSKAAEFHVEHQLYAHPLVSTVLPKLLFAADNSDRTYMSRSGFEFPPFLVMERGSSLSECAPFANAHNSSMYMRVVPVQMIISRS